MIKIELSLLEIEYDQRCSTHCLCVLNISTLTLDEVYLLLLLSAKMEPEISITVPGDPPPEPVLNVRLTHHTKDLLIHTAALIARGD